MGPIWGRQDPSGPHVGPMNFVIWDAMGKQGLVKFEYITAFLYYNDPPTKKAKQIRNIAVAISYSIINMKLAYFQVTCLSSLLFKSYCPVKVIVA